MGPFEVMKVYDYGVGVIKGDDGNIKVNLQRLKLYLGNEHHEEMYVALVGFP